MLDQTLPLCGIAVPLIVVKDLSVDHGVAVREQGLEVEAPRRFVVQDGFADDAGQPDPDLPTTRMELELDERADGGTTMTVVSTFVSTAAMTQMLEMGMEDGMRQAMCPIDGILSEAG